MTELETMQRAKMYIDKLAKGINPLDDSVIPEDDIINNVRLSRCLFYVSDVLRQVIDNGGVTPPKRKKKEKFNITFEQIQRFQFSEMSLQISKITDIFGKDAKDAINKIEDTLNAGKDYKSFSGINEGMDGSVKFIFKTAEIKADK